MNMTLSEKLELEQNLLGSIMADNEVYLSVASFLRSFHFTEPLHAKIYEEAAYLIGMGRVAHPITVKIGMPADLNVGHLSIAQYLGELFQEALPQDEAYECARAIYAAGAPCGSSGWEKGLTEGVWKMLSDLEGCACGVGESPIERMFVSAALLLNFCQLNWFDFGKSSGETFMSYVFPQEKIENYRVDFLIIGRGPCDGINIVVECDGHEFHERTPEQALRDRQRDRRLQALGYHVLRFTGAELFNRSFACASEVALFMAQKSTDPRVRPLSIDLTNFIAEARKRQDYLHGQ